jgi:hypothetical protein
MGICRKAQATLQATSEKGEGKKKNSSKNKCDQRKFVPN